MHIAIVDDSILILKHAQQILVNHHMPVKIFGCKSGREFLELCGQIEIDIVLLDIVMPELDGIEVLKRLKSDERYKFIDVLMFSSLSDKMTLKACFDLGAVDYIPKPIDEFEFVSRVQSAVNKKNYEKSNIAFMKEIQDHNTELKKLNLKLHETQSQLFQQEKLASVGHLAAGVAHEINNPLGFISGNVSALRKYTDKYVVLVEQIIQFVNETRSIELDSTLRTHLVPILEMLEKTDFQFINDDIYDLYKDTTEGISRVEMIVKNLRNFSRIDQMEERGPYNLNSGVENTLLIAKNEIKYTADVELQLGDISDTEASGGQINQVILNIVLNAVFAIKTKDENTMGKIVLHTWEDELSIHLTIRDNGVGISNEHLSNIFNPFYTTKPPGEGTGLGLSISYDIIVQKHHGSITVESHEGEWTEFHITLPKSRFGD